MVSRPRGSAGVNRKLIADGVRDGTRTVVYSVLSEPGEVGEYHSHDGFTTLTVVEGRVVFESWDGTERHVLSVGQSQKESTTLHRVTDQSNFGSHMLVVIQHPADAPPMRDENGKPIYI